MIFRVRRDPRAAGGDGRVRPAPIQPERASCAKQNRAKPNKTKQNCFDFLLFIHVYFFETSYFNELQAIQTKKILLLWHARSGCEYGRVARSRLGRTQPRRSARVKFVIAELSPHLRFCARKCRDNFKFPQSEPAVPSGQAANDGIAPEIPRISSGNSPRPRARVSRPLRRSPPSRASPGRRGCPRGRSATALRRTAVRAPLTLRFPRSTCGSSC
jgi:hypothetical protein